MVHGAVGSMYGENMSISYQERKGQSEHYNRSSTTINYINIRWKTIVQKDEISHPLG
jgi:hypothetical protein